MFGMQSNPYAFADQDRIAANRQEDFWGRPFNPASSLSGGRTVGGPLPDRAWDSFFGALQRKNDETGGKLNVDLVGRHGSSGIGTTMAQDVPSGQTYNMDRGEIAPGFTKEARDPRHAGDAQFQPTGPVRAAMMRGLQSAVGRRY
jgi:hypothetical protein